MSRAEAIENEIINLLKTALKDFKGLIKSHPENPSTYRTPSPAGDVFVRYTGSGFKYDNLGVRTRQRTPKLEIILVFRHLRSHQGAYALLDKIDKTLTGKYSELGGQYKLTDEKFLGEDRGIWQFGQSYEINQNETIEEDATISFGT